MSNINILWYLDYQRGDVFLGGIYVWARDTREAESEAERLGAPADAVAGAHPPEQENLSTLLPVGFQMRWLSPEEVLESHRAVRRARKHGEVVRAFGATV